MAKDKTFGGTGALFGMEDVDAFLDGTAGTVNEVAIDLIDRDETQPRKNFAQDNLLELQKSIEAHGILQPLVVTKTDDGRYRIIAGERRFRAARAAHLTSIPVVIKEDLTSRQALEMALIENLQREDLNPMEEALALNRLIKDHQLTHAEVADRIGKSRSAITNAIRLLELPEELSERVAAGALSAGHARALLALPDDEARIQIADRIPAEMLSVRQTEALVKSLLEAKNVDDEEKPKKAKKELPPEFRAAQEKLSSVFDTKVRIVGNAKKGKITIDYYSEEQLNNLYEALRGTDAE